MKGGKVLYSSSKGIFPSLALVQDILRECVVSCSCHWQEHLETSVKKRFQVDKGSITKAHLNSKNVLMTRQQHKAIVNYRITHSEHSLLVTQDAFSKGTGAAMPLIPTCHQACFQGGSPCPTTCCQLAHMSNQVDSTLRAHHPHHHMERHHTLPWPLLLKMQQMCSIWKNGDEQNSVSQTLVQRLVWVHRKLPVPALQ